MVSRKTAKQDFIKGLSIDKDSPVPLHLQLSDNIKEIIVKNRMKGGYPVPCETWIADSFEINRNTVHRAYESLAMDGFLELKEGRRGMFVSETISEKYIRSFPAVGILLNRSFYSYLKTSNEFMTEYLGGVVDRATETQHSTMILNLPECDGDPEKMEFWLEKTVSRLTGIVHLGSAFDDHDSRCKQLLDYQNIPQVYVSGTSPLPHISTVGSDLSSGVIALADLLKDNGHDQIALFTSYASRDKGMYAFHYDSAHRSQKVAECLVKAGLKVQDEFFIKCEENKESQRAEIAQALSQNRLPKAIWCQNDTLALQLIKILNDMGLRVPEDISIIGYDDIREAALSSPPLTTIKNPAYTIGRYATDVLMELFKTSRPGEARHINVPTSLVIRGSVGPAREVDE